MNRRQFMRTSAGVAALLAARQRAHAAVNSPGLGKWLTTLRGLGPGGIPVAASDGIRTWPGPTVATHYSIDIRQFTDQLHPSLPPTTLWGYGQGPAASFRHLGGVIVAQKNTPVQITFRNHLPATHILPVDITIPGANQAQNRVAVHIHGGHVPWISDGGPHDWWDPIGTHGLSFLNNAVLRPGDLTVQPNEAEYYYPNDQSARLMWYHDHAWGITRLNAYAGIATGYVITDAAEAAITSTPAAPGKVIPFRQLPVVIQDKIFVPANIAAVDPTWTKGGQGSLWYAHVYDPKVFKLKGSRNLPDPSAVAEFFGDTMLANGTVYPEVTVQPARYRLRVLNACNARFLNLQLYVEDATADGITLNALFNPTNPKGPDFIQIGNEGGFLPAPVVIASNGPFNPIMLSGSLIMAPAERAEVIIDFSAYAGKNLILYNDAPAPFPVGAPIYDYFPGNPLNPVQPVPGFGPNTRQIVRFKVATSITDGQPLDALSVPLTLPSIDPPPPPPGTPPRGLTLNESFDAFGRLEQLVGTVVPPINAGQGFGRAYMDPATENVAAGSTEIWEIYNVSADTHPMHFHLVNVQIINRQPFKVQNFNGTPTFLGPPRPPDPNEMGWKETVRMNPGEVTRVIMRFDLPVVPFTVPPSPRTTGNEYVWHCHILEHEEHDMMRPLVVV